MTNYQKSSHFSKFLINLLNKKSILLCYFLIRDIIENIKLYLYLLRGAIKEEIIDNKHGKIIKYIVNEKVKNEIHLKLEKEKLLLSHKLLNLIIQTYYFVL